MAEFTSLNGYDVKDKKAVRVYDNVEAMKEDYSIQAGQTVQTLGFYEVNDGGSAEYVISDDETLTPDGVKIIKLDNNLFAKLIIKESTINIVSLGADPTAITSATNILRKAIASIDEGVIYIPKGHYKITDSISLKSGITIKGESRESTFLCPDPTTMGVSSSSEGVKPVFRTSENNIENVSIYDISLDCLHWQDDTKVYGVLFSTSYILNNFTAMRLGGLGQYQLLKFNRGDNYQITDIICDSSEKTLPEPSENIISLGGNNHVIISDIICKDSVEIIDMAGSTDISINNVSGYSSLNDENEAIDIGGSNNVIVNNVHIDGFGQGIKIKEETDLVKSYDIIISNSIFKNFGDAGIEFKTNYVLNDYVIENVIIENCQFINTSSARGITNTHSSNNYGMKNIIVRDCIFNLANYAILIELGKDIFIENNKFLGTYNYSCLGISGYTSALDTTKLGNINIIHNYFKHNDTSSSNTIKIETIDNITLANNKFEIGNGISINCLNVSSGKIFNNIINGGKEGIRFDSNSHSYYNPILNITISNNNISNISTTGIRYSQDGNGTQSTAVYKGLVISNNDIRNVSSTGTTGLLLRSRYTTLGFDYISILNNTIINFTNGLTKDQFTMGSNCVESNLVQ